MEKNFCTKIVCSSAIAAFAAFAYLALAGAVSPSLAAEGKLDTAKIEQLTGVKGELSEKEGVFKVTVPRSDLKVTVAGVKMTPPMGLASYAAFMKAGAMTMVMGDTTLLEDQVNPVMSVALDNGLEVTALHNHFITIFSGIQRRLCLCTSVVWAMSRSSLLRLEKYSQKSKKPAVVRGRYQKPIWILRRPHWTLKT